MDHIRNWRSTPSTIYPLSSIQRFGDRAAVKQKQLGDTSAPIVVNGKPLPGASYEEDMNVYDCTSPSWAVAENSIFKQIGRITLSFLSGPTPNFLKSYRSVERSDRVLWAVQPEI